MIFHSKKQKNTIMKNLKREFTEISQVREFKTVFGENKWMPRIEKKYKFFKVEEFLEEFTPEKPSENLLNAICKAYKNSGSVTFLVKGIKGNKIFDFKKTV